MAWYRPWDKQGNVARERRQQEQAERTMWEQRTADPYGENPPQWDEAGFPVGPMPRGKYSLDYQYEANRRAESQRRALWGDAQNSMRQGLDLFQSYRPGGSAAAASGMFGQKAGLYATQALNTSAPDLLIDWREQIRQRAEENANELNRNAQLITGLSALNPIAGGTLAALTQQPAQPGQQNTQPAGGTYNVGTDNSAAFNAAGGGSPGMQGGPSTPMPVTTAGGAGGGGVLPGLLAPERSIGGGTAGLFEGGTTGGQAGGGGGGGGRPGGGAAPGGGGGQSYEGDAGVIGAAGGGGLGDYSGQAVADRSLGTAPMAADMTTSIWSEDPYREQSTALMAQSARQTLLDALALG